MNGTRVTQVNETFFIPLPIESRRVIEGGCDCAYCKTHPDKTPQWDTLAVASGSPYAWTVHFPELQGHSPGETIRAM
jgi:hypothetical protein